jgi:hypothetical protein
MAYDTDLANRIRECLADEAGITEKKMFGGLAFLAGGNMAVSASGRGGILVRVDPLEAEGLCEKPGASQAEMSGRAMTGFLRVDDDAVATSGSLEPWVRRGLARARALPAKG